MAESATPARRRARRPTRISRQLAEARERNAAQLARQREQEQAVESALAEFFGAGEQIAAARADAQRKIEPHERAIAGLRERLGQRVAGAEAAQARAALAIHDADRTVEQVGELLGLGEKAARRLIAAGRAAATDDNQDTDQPDGGQPERADTRDDRSPVVEPAAEPVAAGDGEPDGQQPVLRSLDRDLAVSGPDTASQ